MTSALVTLLVCWSPATLAHGPEEHEAAPPPAVIPTETTDPTPEPSSSSEGSAPDPVAELDEGTRNVSFHGRLRLRGLFRTGIAEHAHDQIAHQHQTMGAMLQVRLGMTWTPYEWLSFHLEGQDAHALGEGFEQADATPSDQVNLFDLRKAYVEVHTRFGDAPMRIRIGRQTMFLGNGTMVASDEWKNVPMMWDAARVTIGSPANWQLDLWSGWTVVRDPRHFDGHQISGDRVADSFFHGLYVTIRDALPGTDLESYLLIRHAPDHDDRVLTVGARFDWSDEAWQIKGEAAAQIGVFDGANHLAFLARGTVGYGFPELLDLHLEAGVTFASGDGNPGDGIHRTFDAPYGHPHWGPMELFGLQNILAITWQARARVWDDLTVRMELGSFLLPESSDAWYSAHSHEVARREGGKADPYIGTQIGLGAHFPWDDWMNISFGASYLFGGGYVSEVGSGQDAAMVYLGVSTEL